MDFVRADCRRRYRFASSPSLRALQVAGRRFVGFDPREGFFITSPLQKVTKPRVDLAGPFRKKFVELAQRFADRRSVAVRDRGKKLPKVFVEDRLNHFIRNRFRVSRPKTLSFPPISSPAQEAWKIPVKATFRPAFVLVKNC